MQLQSAFKVTGWHVNAKEWIKDQLNFQVFAHWVHLEGGWFVLFCKLGYPTLNLTLNEGTPVGAHQP